MTPRGITRGYTICRYGQLHFRQAGEASKFGAPPLLMLHQNPSSSLEFEPFIGEMARDRAVLAFDTPGNGMSDPPPAPPGLAGYAAAFADGLDALDFVAMGKIDVFGFHTGAYLAIELALSRPDLVGRLILSGIPLRAPEERESRLRAALQPVPLEEDGAAIFTFIKNMWAFTVAGRNPRTSMERALAVFAERLRPMHRHAWPYIGVWSYKAEETLPRITQPTLVLQPHEMLLEQSRQAAKLIPGALLVELPELDKDPFETGAQTLGREVRQWKSVPF